MKLKPIAIMLSSFFALGAKASHTEESGFNHFIIRSDDPKKLVQASILIGHHQLKNNFEVLNMNVDTKNGAIEMSVGDISKTKQLKTILKDIKSRFGSSIRIEQVDLNSLSHGTQDDIIK